MEESPVTDGDDYASHRQLALVDAVTPISLSLPNSSSFTHCSLSSSAAFSLPGGLTDHKVPLSDGIPFDTKPENQMMITSGADVSPTSTRRTSKFTLPEGWVVKAVPRKSGSTKTHDKYYHDPKTGRIFRSMKEVERYITGVTPAAKSRPRRLNYHHDEKNSGSRKMMVCSGKMLDFEDAGDNQYQLTLVSPSPKSISSTSPFKLPDGWIVEEVPRSSGGYIDKYYHEPGTGKRFRSLRAVERHLAEENSPLSIVLEKLKENNLPLSKAFKLGSPTKKKKNISEKEQTSSYISPPSKINWVIADSGGDSWNAFIGDTPVSASVKQKWGKRFMSAIKNSKQNLAIPGE